ncbi:MAG TPA: diguanylate cyclase [Leptolyngbyaceae cyanobacterium]
MQQSELYSHTVKSADNLVARYGGEEFAVLLPDTGIEQARRSLHRFNAMLVLYSYPIPNLCPVTPLHPVTERSRTTPWKQATRSVP